ncbi:MAG: prepilin-type N-terminal cleavage/methylation domain-containing protein [Candidatus Saccharimonas sp.]
MKRLSSGFTIIELIIVIATIGILVTIGVVSYRGATDRAEDAKIRDGADKIADAIQLFVVGKGHFPLGGWGSTTVIGAGSECIDGGAGWFGSGIYTCSVEDTLVASGLLPPGFSAGLPQMPGYGAGSSRTIMVYVANASTKIAMVYNYLALPTSADTAHFNAELTKCGYNPALAVGPRDSYGMRDGTCISY